MPPDTYRAEASHGGFAALTYRPKISTTTALSLMADRANKANPANQVSEGEISRPLDHKRQIPRPASLRSTNYQSYQHMLLYL